MGSLKGILLKNRLTFKTPEDIVTHMRQDFKPGLPTIPRNTSKHPVRALSLSLPMFAVCSVGLCHALD